MWFLAGHLPSAPQSLCNPRSSPEHHGPGELWAVLGLLWASESPPSMETLSGEWLSVPTLAAQRRTPCPLLASLPRPGEWSNTLSLSWWLLAPITGTVFPLELVTPGLLNEQAILWVDLDV